MKYVKPLIFKSSYHLDKYLKEIGKNRILTAEEEKDLNRLPNPGEIADRLNMTKEEVLEAIEIAPKHVSLNAPLNEKEAVIIKLYYGIDRENSLTLEKIGDMFGLTRERVRQIKERAIRKLQHTPKCKKLLLH